MSPTRPARRRVTAGELGARLAADPEYQQRMAAKEFQRRRIVAENRRDEEPLLHALASAGVPVTSVSDLYNRRLNYRDVIPLLMDWLPRISNVDVKEGIVRALSVPWAKPAAAPLLIAELEKTDDSSLRWAIANALEVVGDAGVLPQLIDAARDKQYGSARQMLTLALGNIPDSRSEATLLELLNDPEVTGHAVMALGRLRVQAAREPIERLIAHPKAWVRAEARKALARIERN